MTSFVEAIRRKYEKLVECHIFESFPRNACNRSITNIKFPTRTLTMDCQQITEIGNEEELYNAAGHVTELDLSGNQLSNWREVFILLRCLDNLESLNLSQNPLGPDRNKKLDLSVDSNDDSNMDSIKARTRAALRSGSYEGITSGLLKWDTHFTNESATDNLGYRGSVPNKLNHTDHSVENFQYLNGLCNSVTLHGYKRHLLPPVQAALETNCLSPITLFPRLTILALNATCVPWSWVLELLRHFPNLHTLHVALNNYGADEDRLDGSGDSFEHHANHSSVFHNLRTLYYSDNGISSWWTVCRLGRHFPKMEHLILLGNPLEHIPAPLPAREIPSWRIGHSAGRLVDELTDVCSRLSPVSSEVSQVFPHLHTLSLSETMLKRWESVDVLGEWMPRLTNLRLGNSLPLFESWPEPQCRAHVIARLPNLITYNRSVIDSEEREKAEREFVRYFGQTEPHLRPIRYWELERQHGRLEPLANIDLSPKRFVRVRVVLEDKEVSHELNLNLKVCQVKRQLCGLFGIDAQESKRFRLFYFDQVMSLAQGPEELRYPGRSIHSYQLEPGDLFELVRVASSCFRSG